MPIQGDACKQGFNSLQVFYKLMKSAFKAVSWFCFNSLQVFYKLGTLKILKRIQMNVSIPYRYSINLGLAQEQGTTPVVSIPYRYSINTSYPLRHLKYFGVSIPYRYSINPVLKNIEILAQTSFNSLQVFYKRILSRT